MTIRIAVAGVGKRSIKVLGYLRAAIPDMQIVGYVDPEPKIVEQLDEGRPVAAYDDVDAMLAQTSADLLFIGSPNHLHLGHIASGLRAGVQVFCEKPVVISLDETWDLAGLLREYGTDRVMVGLVLRYAPQIKDLNEALAAGQLGQLVSLEANEHIEPQHGGFFMRDWRRYSRYSGGFMLEKCCHDIDIYQMVTGSRVQRVASFGGRKTFTPENAPTSNEHADLYHTTPSLWETTNDPFHSDADIIDHQNAILQFESAVTMSFHTNLNVPDQSRHFCIVGTKGMAEGDLERGYLRITDAASKARVVDIDYTQIADATIDHYGSDKQMTIEIADYLQGQRKSLPVSIVDAMEAGVAAMALDQARTTCGIVDLTETWAKLDSYNLRSAP